MTLNPVATTKPRADRVDRCDGSLLISQQTSSSSSPQRGGHGVGPLA